MPHDEFPPSSQHAVVKVPLFCCGFSLLGGIVVVLCVLLAKADTVGRWHSTSRTAAKYIQQNSRGFAWRRSWAVSFGHRVRFHRTTAALAARAFPLAFAGRIGEDFKTSILALLAGVDVAVVRPWSGQELRRQAPSRSWLLAEDLVSLLRCRENRTRHSLT